MRTGHVQFEAIGDWFQDLSRVNEVRDRGAEYRDEKELIRRDVDGIQFRPERDGAGIREAYGIDVASVGVLSENWFAISSSGAQAYALGCNDAN